MRATEGRLSPERGSVAVFLAIVMGFLVPAVLYWLVGLTQLRMERSVLARILDTANLAGIAEVEPGSLWPSGPDPVLPESSESVAREWLRLNLRQVAPLLSAGPDEAAALVSFERQSRTDQAILTARGELPVRFIGGREKLRFEQSATVRPPRD